MITLYIVRLAGLDGRAIGVTTVEYEALHACVIDLPALGIEGAWYEEVRR